MTHAQYPSFHFAASTFDLWLLGWVPPMEELEAQGFHRLKFHVKNFVFILEQVSVAPLEVTLAAAVHALYDVVVIVQVKPDGRISPCIKKMECYFKQAQKNA